MECSWDSALLRRGDQLPPELLDVIRTGSNDEYLRSIAKAALDPRYTNLLFTNCEDVFAQVCAQLRQHGNLAASLATLGRIVPFAPHLSTYAERLLKAEQYSAFGLDVGSDLLYLLGLFRLLRYDSRVYKPFVDLSQISALLGSSNRPVVYLAIRILQLYLHGADHWFEAMSKQYLGADTPENAIGGSWDDISIDYRFLTLWEDERHERLLRLFAGVQAADGGTEGGSHRIISQDSLDPSVALVGGMCLPCENDTTLECNRNGAPVIETNTITRNLRAIAKSMKQTRPILLTGLAGSGKTMLARHLALKLGKLDSMITLHLNEQSDAKLLVGVYATGTAPGSFVWKPGVLTTAVREGRWVMIEDLDRASNEVMGTLLPLIEKRELMLPSRKQTIHAASGFRIIATVRTTTNHRGDESTLPAHMLGSRLWQKVRIAMPPLEEQHEIARKLFPTISALLPQLVAAYDRLQSLRSRSKAASQSGTGVLRPLSPRDLLKWCTRTAKLIQSKTSFTSSDMDDIFLEAVDCFFGSIPDGTVKSDFAAIVAEVLHIDPRRRDHLLTERDAQYVADSGHISVGRYVLPRVPPSRKSGTQDGAFSTNPHTSRVLERVAAAVTNREPLLLVGETGVGKTTAVQHLAAHLNKKLVPFNLSQQSEAGDLLGGFKPVNARSLVVAMQDEFLGLFTSSFSMTKNQDFMKLLSKQMSSGNWKAVCKLWQQALKMVEQQRVASRPTTNDAAPNKKRKLETRRTIDFGRWDAFSTRVSDMQKRLATGKEAFAFRFVEGNIVKAVRNGDWILLDEVNLASMDTLEAISDLLSPSSPSIFLAEAGDVERIDAHPDCRIFAAMNPATDVGKKDLPPGIRSRFTELYVESPDKDTRSLQSIVRAYLRSETATDQAIPSDVSTVYQGIIALSEQNRLVDGAAQRPHFSLRTLTRTLSYAKHIAPLCSVRRALYEGFQMSFLTFLDVESAQLVQPILEKHLFGKRTNIRAELQKAMRKPTDTREYVQGWPGSKHWVRRGGLELEDQPFYILTPFIRGNIENLVRATSTRRFPVLIQGPTSSGKTSMIEYLAKRTGHHFVRINNHEHTDLQEYLGTYISGSDGRLQFEEGILLKALREGHWLVLDELNLAPTDVLEALNRLLDDNRELLIPETQEVVRPHEDFMLFATQNPAGLYGGRKTLSRAFRNRFLELHFDDIPVDELQEILHRRTQLPESRCKRIVAVYRELSVLRQESRLFEQKSFATLRDLFRWALRPNDTIEQLADNGFMLLAERVRKPEERRVLKDIIEKAMSAKGPRVTIDEEALYSRECAEILNHQCSASSQGVVWTNAMRRLYVLVSRAIANDEPVLLVGETGCGKTTVCQMLADALGTELYTVNAHQNTETGDLIGSQRPLRNRAAVEASLRSQLMGSGLLSGPSDALTNSTDVLLELYDRAFAALGAQEQTARLQTSHREIQASRTRFKALFEWVDGSLVEAMKTGAHFLLDEISLADDSVLERLNSVLEPSRSILLAEKGSLDSFVTAASCFQFLATMNPGGDYGKRELSPALRNRFTEIWVPSLNDLEDVTEIVTAKLVDAAKPYTAAIVAFAQWFEQEYNTSASSSISIRDALAWVSFINTASATSIQAAVVHGAAMVYIDTLGANPAGLITMTRYSLFEERRACLIELSKLLRLDAGAIYSAPNEVYSTDGRFIAGDFSITSRRSSEAVETSFSFEPPTTQVNTMRVVRALQLSKPVLLEGSPGVGKTALVTAVSEAVSTPLTRINLSEQTDLLDLFGSDVPVSGAETGNFRWRDAPFLRAMKQGEWVLLDEMNLASQSVLEGLNACLDHRGEVFVPELGQTFVRHPDFRLFAAQNPHHQGGGRKGLPASFVNRFTVVYADAFKLEDLALICRRRFPSMQDHNIEKAVVFVEQLEHQVTNRRRAGVIGGPWEFNLRDVCRWLELASSGKGLLRAGSGRDFVDVLFSQRFRSTADQAIVLGIFEQVFGSAQPRNDLFPTISTHALQLGLGLLARDTEEVPPSSVSTARPAHIRHGRVLESLMLCVQQNWPIILTGSSGAGKTTLIERLASAVGADLVTIAMNAETDTLDLVGGYEQYDPQRYGLQAITDLRRTLLEEVRRTLTHSFQASHADASRLRELDRALSSDQVDMERVVETLRSHSSLDINDVVARLQHALAGIDKARFEWVDGLLVDALQHGKWLVLDNANLCSSSVLDRLNSLLEPNGSLIVNEHSTDEGVARIIRPHPSFRVFMTVDARYGELSRAMRNRTVELHLPEDPDAIGKLSIDPLFAESAVARFRYFGASAAIVNEASADELVLMLHDHLSVSDQPLLARFRHQLSIGLYSASSGTVASSPTAIELAQVTRPFYDELVAQLQGPADYANVQTLHPLNNQPLVCTTPSGISQASSLAVHFDLRVTVIAMQRLSQALSSNTSLMKHLRRLEQSWTLPHVASGTSKHSRLVTMLWRVADCFKGFAQSQLSFTEGHVRSARLLFDRLYTVWAAMHAAVTDERVDQARINCLLAILDKLIQRASGSLEPPQSALLLQQITGAIEPLRYALEGTQGLACTTLWDVFRPSTPRTLEQLNELLRFEALLHQFDRMCQASDITIKEAAELRIQLAQALEIAKHGGRGLSALTEKLRNLGLGAQGVDDNIELRSSHFLPTFQRLHERFVSVGKDASMMQPTIVAELEIFAQYPTTQSRLAIKDARGIPLPPRNSGNDERQPNSLFMQIRSAPSVPLGDLERLATESRLLGRVISSQAHVFATSELGALDRRLEEMFSTFMRGLQASQDAELMSIASAVADSTDVVRNDEQEKNETTMLQLQATLRNVDQYLRAPAGTSTGRCGIAATAWMSFAVAALHLYIPSTTFDPALEPTLKVQLHTRHRQLLHGKLNAVRALRFAGTGEPECLRARMIEEEMTALGPQPEAVAVCRPDVSELSRLQADFDALIRTLESAGCYLKPDKPLQVLDDATVQNLDQVEHRLQSYYRAYDDFTGPAILFLQCLRIGNGLAVQSLASAARVGSIEGLVPFVDASLADWLQDDVFLRAARRSSSASDELDWLSAIALRCHVRAFAECSHELHGRVAEAFRSFHALWKSELSEEQKKNAAKSSLYRFKGNDDDQDEPSEEDMNELFPTAPSIVAGTCSRSMQDQAPHIARLHDTIYAPTACHAHSAAGLFHRWLSRSSQDPLTDDNSHLLPAAILGFGTLNNSLSSDAIPSNNYNMYVDSNLPESRRLHQLLRKFQHRFQELKTAWPEHATPEDVLGICSQVLFMPYSTPLPRFFPLLEKLHGSATEWQKIASREYSVAQLLEQLTDLIISWRRLELSAWAGVLNREREQCEETATSWWFVAYESIVAALPGQCTPRETLQSHAEDLLRTLSQFIAASGLGEFSARLRLLRGFVAELSAKGFEDERTRTLHSALHHFIAYYSHFQPPVSGMLDKGLADLEKEAKNIVQVASWKDRNIETLRQSARSSHRKLLKLVKKYRALLAQPVAAIVHGGIPERPTTDPLSSGLLSSIADLDSNEDAASIDSVEAWTQRADRFRNAGKTAAMVGSKVAALLTDLNGHHQITSFTSQLAQDVAALQKATPPVLTDKNKTLVSHLKTRKRRLFADVLKQVRAMGFQTAMSTKTLSAQASTELVLAQLPASTWAHADAGDLYRLVDIMITVRQYAGKPSDDLTPAEVARSVSLLESMLQQCILQYCDLSRKSEDLASLQTISDKFRSLAACRGLTKSSMPSIVQLKESAASIAQVLPICIEALKQQVRMLDPGHDGSLLSADLADCKAQAETLQTQAKLLPALPSGIESNEYVEFRHAHAQMQGQLRKAAKVIATQRPETAPVIYQLKKWLVSEVQEAERPSNGHTSMDVSSWSAKSLGLVDTMLVAVQAVEKMRDPPGSESSWLTSEQKSLRDILDALQIAEVTTVMQALLSKVRNIDHASEANIRQVAAMSRSLCPIVDAYARAVQEVLAAYSAHHIQTSRTAYKLATTFTTLCQKGFCTPSDKTDDKPNPEGNAESGTGLGDGEGAEDISKDVAPDEDLSELAQEAKHDQAEGEIEEERDAVDMADEDLAGGLDDPGSGTEEEDGAGSGDDADEDADMAEESGHVDDQCPSAVDEKMWDGGGDEDQRDKQTNEAKGPTNDEDAVGGKDSSTGQEEEVDDEGAAARTEDVRQETVEQMDPHTHEEDTLELPDDMNMDNAKDTESGDSDSGSVLDPEEFDATEAPEAHDRELQDTGNEVDEQSQEEAQPNAGDEAADDDAASDMLMRDNEQPDPYQDTQDQPIVPPEAGSGPDQVDSSDQTDGQGKSSASNANDEQGEGPGETSSEQKPAGTAEPGDATADGEEGVQEDKLPFKQIGDALHEWYDHNSDIQQAQKPDQSDNTADAVQQSTKQQYQHLPDESTQPDTQALGTASTEESMTLDKEQALHVDDGKRPDDIPFQELDDESLHDENDQSNEADAMQLDPSDARRREPQSNAFVAEPEDNDVETTGGPERDEEAEMQDMDQQLLETHISKERDTEHPTIEEARTQWATYEENTRSLAMMLAEHLRLIMQPTQATKMRGDFRTGKRLNIKRIIPYIASSYKRDKIWMRRSVPSKRAYQVMLAIDDSESMRESGSRHLAFETLAMVTKGLSVLEAGELSVVGFGERVKIAYDFSSSFTSDAGAEIFKRLSFGQKKTNVRKLLEESIQMFQAARLKASSSASDLWQLQLIVSDGICEDHPSIRQLVRQAHEERIMIVFIVVDAAAQSQAAQTGKKQSILDLQSAEFAKDAGGEMQLKMVKYLDTFPFGYYLIVRDVHELPGVLAGALRQWFAEVVEANG